MYLTSSASWAERCALGLGWSAEGDSHNVSSRGSRLGRPGKDGFGALARVRAGSSMFRGSTL